MSERKIKAACVQLRCGDDVAENVRSAAALIREAHKAGAQFIATPENTNLMAADGGAKLEKTSAEKDDYSLPQFCGLAEELGIWLLVGSLGIKVSEGKTANRSYLIGPNGRVSARYDKIHLFDVNLPSGETYRESNTVAPGGEAVVANPPFGKIGMSVCYDLRFPHLYRALAKGGAEILTVPSAFTETTGKAHWHILLRARAIENGCFVVAPAQGGAHANGRKTYGHSLIVGPWGDILAEAGTDPSFVAADLDLAEIAAVRARLPSLQHDRPFRVPE
ncbi:MAG TPA: carbon-nitrogen hydrolase family protein [Micropepsaceae bacterium]|jgi:predicted amidohydrolase|nr:carbon-nitrogen hydrolase family protein [Micropepsaceae bacterium]